MVFLLAFAAGCSCEPFAQGRFTCVTQAECAEGFECRDLGAGLECVRAGTAVDAGGVDAGEGDAGEGDAGEQDAGLDAGADDAGIDAGVDAGTDAGVDGGSVAVALRFATTPQTVVAGGCSPVIVVETVNAGGSATPVSTLTTVALSAAPNGVSFFTGSSCAAPAVTSVTIAANASSATFYASGSPARTFTLVANSAPLTGTSQPFVVANPPNALVFTTTPPDPVRGGTCLPATVEARRTGVPSPVITTTAIGLTAVPSGGARFFTDATCATTTSSATMLGGASSASFFVKPLTAGANVISAAAPFGTAMQTINTTPIVRRGTCTFPARTPLADGGATSALTQNCTLSPAVTDLSASFSMIQTIGAISTADIGVAEVRCRLTGTSTLSCFRRQDADPVDVHFQVAEVPQGMLVQRSSGASCPGTITLPTAVVPSRTFVIKATMSATATFDDEDTEVAELTSPTTVTLTPTTCDGHEVQVVDWAGVTVTRGVLDGGLPLGTAALTLAGLPAASGERALLLQPGTTLNGTRQVCSTLVRGAMPSASTISFTRAAGDTACTLTPMENVLYERIDFGPRATVREYTATLAPTVGSLPVTVTPVDASRTIVFASSQIAGGQGAGETSHGGTAHFTEGLFQLQLTAANTVTVTRAETSSSAQVTFYVAELVP